MSGQTGVGVPAVVVEEQHHVAAARGHPALRPPETPRFSGSETALTPAGSRRASGRSHDDTVRPTGAARPLGAGHTSTPSRNGSADSTVVSRGLRHSRVGRR